MTIREMFAKLPTASSIEVFDHERSFGIVVVFSETNFGWGEITLAVDKATGKACCDLESMSPEHCGKILMRSVGTEVKDAAAEWAKIEQAAADKETNGGKDDGSGNGGD